MDWSGVWIEWAGTLVVLAFSWRGSQMRRIAAVALVIGLALQTCAGLYWSNTNVVSAEEYWSNINARFFCDSVQNAVGAAIFWGLRHHAKWVGRLGTLYFLQETAYCAFALSPRSYATLHNVEWLIFLLCLAQLAVVGGKPISGQLATWLHDWRDDRGAVGGARGFRRMGSQAIQAADHFLCRIGGLPKEERRP